MGSERLLRNPPSPEVVAERKRVLDALGAVLDETIRQHATVNHAVAEALLGTFAADFVWLRKFVREGWTPEEFAAARSAGLPTAKEVGEAVDGHSDERGRGA